MLNGCVHGDKCSYLHNSSKKANSGGTSSETKPKAKPASKPAAKPKVMAAVALLAMVSPVEGLLEFAAGSGAGCHLVSHEVLAQQGVDSSVIEPFLRPSRESLRFHTGGGDREIQI